MRSVDSDLVYSSLVLHLRLSQAVDIYPTLAELAGLPDPKNEGEGLNGTSLATVFDDPTTMVKQEAYSQFGKTSTFDIDAVFLRNQTELMG